MNWKEFALSRQLIAEERYGKAARASIKEEDAAWNRATEALHKLGA